MSDAALAEPSRHDAGGSALHGRAAVLVLVGAEAGGSANAVIEALAGARGLFEAQNATVACVVGDARTRVSPGLAVAEDAALIARCGIGARDILVLLRDRKGRVLLALEPEEGVDPVAACLGCLQRLDGPSDADPEPLVRAMAAPLAVGNRAPACFGMTADRRFYSSEEQYGRPAVLILADAAAEVGPVLSALGAVLPAIAACGADVLLVTQGNPVRLAAMVSAPVRVVDAGDFLSRCGMAGREIRLLLLDRNQRIMLVRPACDAAAALADCVSCLDALPREAPRQVAAPAPAIVLPHLLPPEMCRHLIALFDSVPVVDSGVARVDAAGRVGNVVDHAKKRRRDMLIEPGTDLHTALRDALLGRCRGEIAKAFQCRVGFADRMLVACYDSSGGWFRLHRDNDADQVAFREFALSLNLNTGAYEGGCLMFPEYNDHLYSPPAGGGVIFSASVLHEVTPVTAGRRYVLLTFLHGEMAEARRLAWEARAGG